MRTISKLGAALMALFFGLLVVGTNSGPSGAANVSYSASALQTNFQGILLGISCPTAGSCISVGAQ